MSIFDYDEARMMMLLSILAIVFRVGLIMIGLDYAFDRAVWDSYASFNFYIVLLEIFTYVLIYIIIIRFLRNNINNDNFKQEMFIQVFFGDMEMPNEKERYKEIYSAIEKVKKTDTSTQLKLYDEYCDCCFSVSKDTLFYCNGAFICEDCFNGNFHNMRYLQSGYFVDVKNNKVYKLQNWKSTRIFNFLFRHFNILCFIWFFGLVIFTINLI